VRKIKDLEAVRFCGEVYIFSEKSSEWVLERHAGAISITYTKLPGENKKKFIKRLRAHEAEIEFNHCMACTDLCRTVNYECSLYRKHKLAESED